MTDHDVIPASNGARFVRLESDVADLKLQVREIQVYLRLWVSVFKWATGGGLVGLFTTAYLLYQIMERLPQ